jgi:molybdopterin synthase sulfur carrier subunit
MKISVKLNGRFVRYLPVGATGKEAVIEVDDSDTTEAVLTKLGLPLEKCRLVLINGEFSSPDERDKRRLFEGDHVAVWPPLAGGAGRCIKLQTFIGARGGVKTSSKFLNVRSQWS